MQKKGLVIINQHTAKQRLRVELLGLLDIFTRGGYECVTRPTQKAGDATAYTKDNAADFDLVVTIGGDGTLNEVIAGLCELEYDRRPPIGYIPAGTTNDFAAGIGLPTDPIEAAKLIVSGSPHRIDCGRIDGHIFNYVASFGAFTEVSYDTPQPLKNLFGHFAYLLEGVKHLGDIKPTRLTFDFVRADGAKERLCDDFAFGALANTLSIGGVIHLDKKEVDLCDGLHEYLLVPMPTSIAELNETVRELSSLQNPDRRSESRIYYGKFSHGAAKFAGVDTGVAWSIDGERIVTGSRCEIENLHEAWKLVI